MSDPERLWKASFDEARLAEFRCGYAPKSLERSELLKHEYLLATDGRHHVYYSPIGAWPHEAARIMFVGLTPGFTQMQAAAKTFMETPEPIRSDERLYSDKIRTRVSFAGSMRSNLCQMLDLIGLPGWLQINHSEQLFGEQLPELAAATSALVLPVFSGAQHKNFSGSADLSAVPLFRTMIAALLLPRLLRAPLALIVPLGVSANTALTYLVRIGRIDSARILSDFPHPSGNNGHRVKFFERDRDRLAASLRDWNASAGSFMPTTQF